MLSPANLKLGATILGWLFATVTTVVLNKHIFQNMLWKYPLSLTIVHMFVCAAGAFVALRVFKLIPFTTIEKNEYYKGVLPLRYVSTLTATHSLPIQQDQPLRNRDNRVSGIEGSSEDLPPSTADSLLYYAPMVHWSPIQIQSARQLTTQDPQEAHSSR